MFGGKRQNSVIVVGFIGFILLLSLGLFFIISNQTDLQSESIVEQEHSDTQGTTFDGDLMMSTREKVWANKLVVSSEKITQEQEILPELMDIYVEFPEVKSVTLLVEDKP